MESVAAWLKTHTPNGDKAKHGKARAQLDELVARLHRAEQNLEVEAAARRRAEQLADRRQEDAKAAAKWAATLDEESALMHKQQAVLANDLRAAMAELEQLKAGAGGLTASPTTSEQLLRQARDAKASWMQSQDCMRALATAAAAAEGRADKLREQLAAAAEELRSAKSRLACLESDLKAQAQELVASAGQASLLQQQLAQERSAAARLGHELEAAARRALALETQLAEAGLQPLPPPPGGMVRALSEGEAVLLEGCAADREGARGGMSVSLPSPLQPPPHACPELEASICNLSSPAAFSPPLQRAALANWAPRPQQPADGARKPHMESAAGQEAWAAPAAAAFQLAPEKTQSVSKIKFIRPGAERQQPPVAEDPEPGQRGPDEEPAGAAAEAALERSPQAARVDPARLLHGFSAAAEMSQLRASDFAPLAKYHPHFQEEVDGGQTQEPRTRQPLSPVNRNARREGRSPAPKSPLKPQAATSAEDVPAVLPDREQCGPLGMGSRGTDEPVTPHRERGGAAAVHKGLQQVAKFAHKRFSPMRIPGRGGAPERGFPGL